MHFCNRVDANQSLRTRAIRDRIAYLRQGEPGLDQESLPGSEFRTPDYLQNLTETFLSKDTSVTTFS